MKTRILLALYIVFGLSTINNLFAQSIYEPEGITIPGSWNGWTNSANAEEMGNFKMQFRQFGGGQYISQLSVKASGGDVTGGSYEMLFTSGPSSNLYQNKWADGALVLDGLTALKLNGSANNTVTLANDFVYTLIYEDNGYSDSRATILRTTNAPVQILAVSGLPTQSVTAGEAVALNIELSSIKSSEERIYVLYSIDGFETTQSIEVTEFEGVLGLATIPGQADGVKVSFFVVSTTIDATNWGTNRDMFILNWNTNSGSNYSVNFGAIATLVTPVNNAQKLEKNVSFSWTSIESAEAYQIQVTNESDAEFAAVLFDEVVIDTTFSILPDSLNFNSSYLWRVRKSSEIEANWSAVFGFKTRATIEYANLQEHSLIINKGDSVKISGKAYIPEITATEGATENLTAWVGISNENTDPSEWSEDSWTKAEFVSQNGNDDVFEAFIGQDLGNGTYYISMRYQYKNDGFKYGGNSETTGGFWDGKVNRNATLSVAQVTTLVSPIGGIQHVSTTPTLRWNPIPDASFDVQVSSLSDANFLKPVVNLTGIQDSVITVDSTLESGKSYRWRVRMGGATPGPFSESKTFKTRGSIGFFNLQYVNNDTLLVGESLSMYAQFFMDGYTTLSTKATEVSVWIGINPENTNPETWDESKWNLALLNETSLEANNDEYFVETGSDLSAGSYYVASRMAYLTDDFVFGGYSASGGGFWSETNSNFHFDVVEADLTANETIQKTYQTQLNQNYPNPFNPSTTIPFELAAAADVKLLVVDVLGREVATLVNQTLAQGKHTVNFDASRLGSGLYFIRLEAGNQRLVKTMTLIK